MKAGRQTPLVLALFMVLAGCAAGPVGDPPTSERATPPALPAATAPPATSGVSTPRATFAPPSFEPTPSGEPPLEPASLPVRATAYSVDTLAQSAPTSDGGLYIAVVEGLYEEDGRLTLTALDGSGALRPGWPAVLSADEAPCDMAVAADDSLRAVCGSTAHAYDLRGRQLEGWPVDLGGDPLEVEIVGTELHAQVAERRWVAVGPDGSVVGDEGRVPGANEHTATITVALDRSGEPSATMPWKVSLSDDRGVLRGWPVKVPGSASEPVVGRDGTVYLVALGEKEGTLQLIVINRNGKRVANRSALMKAVPPHDGSWYGPYIPQSPVVGPDGSVWVVGESSAYAFDPTGRLRDGWPVKLRAPAGSTGYCGPCVIDCYYLPADPFIDAAGTLYVLRAPASKTTGGSVLAIGLDGEVVTGWPVRLKRAGSEFRYGTVGPDGTVFVDAYEPEPTAKRTDECVEPASLTTLAIRPDGTVRYRVTVIDP